MLEVVNLECVRGDRPLFSGLSFSLKPGVLLHVTGANGSGKTTLLRTLCGLSQPATGTIRWNGATIHELGDEYRQHFSYVGHSNAIQGELTPEENLRAAACLSGGTEAAPASKLLKKLLTRFPLPLRERDRVRGDKKQLDESWRYTLTADVSPSPPPSPIEGEGGFQQPARQILEHLGLGAHHYFPAKVLSQGQKRKLALARLAIQRKPLWILDEPLSALDVRSVGLITEILVGHLGTGGMIILTSHQDFNVEVKTIVQIQLDT